MDTAGHTTADVQAPAFWVGWWRGINRKRFVAVSDAGTEDVAWHRAWGYSSSRGGGEVKVRPEGVNPNDED